MLHIYTYVTHLHYVIHLHLCYTLSTICPRLTISEVLSIHFSGFHPICVFGSTLFVFPVPPYLCFRFHSICVSGSTLFVFPVPPYLCSVFHFRYTVIHVSDVISTKLINLLTVIIGIYRYWILIGWLETLMVDVQHWPMLTSTDPWWPGSLDHRTNTALLDVFSESLRFHHVVD